MEWQSRKIIINNFPKQWLEQQLKQRKLQIEDIQYAVISSNGFLFMDLFDDGLTSPADLE